MIWRFTVPGEAVAKGRPRFSKKSGHTYTPAATARFADRVCSCAQEQIGLFKMDGALSITINTFFEWPKSKHLKKGLRPQEPMTEKPDVDNVAKNFMDGMKAWFDDQRVCALLVYKWRAEQGQPAHTDVEIEQVIPVRIVTREEWANRPDEKESKRLKLWIDMGKS